MSIQLFLDGARGQYIPRDFARCIKRDCLSGVKPDDLEYLARGPGGCLDEDQTLSDGETVRGEFYWDVWTDVCDSAVITDDKGQKFTLWQDDSLFLIPEGWEQTDSGEWRPPESETLRRFELPVYWASALINGDVSGLQDGEEKQIDEFIAKNDLQGWTCADCGEQYFSHHNDATSLGGDVAEFTFIKH